jgi:hypothetical protein
MATQSPPKLSACGTDGRCEQGNGAIVIASLIPTPWFIPCESS